MNLESLGWTPYFEAEFHKFSESEYSPARVACEYKGRYLLYSSFGEVNGEISGKLYYLASSRDNFPAVGDWVVTKIYPEEQKAIIHELLPRRVTFSRKSVKEGGAKSLKSGKIESQTIAANIDTIMIVTGLDRDYNLQRIERYLTLIYASGATPVIVLNKADLRADVDTCLAEVATVAPGVPVHVVSALENGLDEMRGYLTTGVTVALVGSSGVGKSTIINKLLGYDRQYVKELSSAVNKGQHTTTSRELILVPGGGLIMDNPGMRELQIWSEESAVETSFQDIEELAEQCRFRNCSHVDEPGCAVQEAIAQGRLTAKRLKNYRSLQREVKYLTRYRNQNAQRAEKERWRKISKMAKRISKGSSNPPLP